MRQLYFFAIFSCTSIVTLLGQAVNNLCADAVEIIDPENYCSPTDAFSLIGATYNALIVPTCQVGENADVWFKFEAIAPDLSVRVNGDAGIIKAGTIQFPEVTVYRGDCNSLTQVGCLSNAFGTGVVELIVQDLIPGDEYTIRVSSRSGELSTFQLCLNNFFNIADPSGDCITGVVLCDKSPFSVPNLIGVGADPNEANGLCIGGEFASAWYKWTCETPGSLYFTLTPNNPSDDLDFALFELPDGIDACGTKRLLRCMASGENLGEPLENWIRCYGPTGLRPGAQGTEERPGCQVGDDNFLAPIEMVSGRSYALIVNNFSNTGSGFSIDFGGEGTFLGPKADFEIADPDRYCRRDSIMVLDQSSATDGSVLESFAWNFGQGSTPRSLNSRGPHVVYYDTPGPKSITLSVINERGCIASRTKRILVECCDYPVFADAGTELTVDLGDNLQLDVIVDLPGGNYEYIWTPSEFLDCPECRSPFAAVNGDTWFTVFVTDDEGCPAIDSVLIRVVKNKPVYIPTAFTPNGDNINDKFTLFTNQAATSIQLLRVYNRWGDLVYEGQDLPPGDVNFGWDGTFRGKRLDPGVFVYYAEVQFLDNEISRFTGEITLYR